MGIPRHNESELKQMTVCGSVGTTTDQIIERISRDMHSVRIPTYHRIKGLKVLI